MKETLNDKQWLKEWSEFLKRGRGRFVCTTRYFSAHPQALIEGGPPCSAPLQFFPLGPLRCSGELVFNDTRMHTHI